MIYILFLIFLSSNLQATNSNFPVDGQLRVRVDFWAKVYTKIDSNHAYIHDVNDLSVIYKIISLPAHSSRKMRNVIKREKKSIKTVMLNIIAKRGENLSEDEQKFLENINRPSPKKLKIMLRNIRTQQGMSRKFYSGLVKSQLYLNKIKKILRSYQIPEELAYLPHVESSFNYRAYSKVGAAGIWQFMRSTARDYRLKLNYQIDERRDPLKATHAAARFLRDNYQKLNSWPCAITAYNHGVHSILRAQKKLGTNNLSTIISKYDGKRFGFASKNFYASFMAAVRLAQNPEFYFGKIPQLAIPNSTTIELTQRYTINQLSRASGIKKETLAELNLELRPILFRRRQAKLPRNYLLKIPLIPLTQLERFKSNLTKIEVPVKRIAVKAVKAAKKRVEKFDLSSIEDTYVVQSKKSAILEIEDLVDFLEEKRASVTSQSIARSYDLKTESINKKFFIITVEIDETLGHYADWLDIPTQTIRNLNYLRFSQNIHIKQKIKLPKGTRESLSSFNQKREQYHLSIEEDFFNNYFVTSTQEYAIKRGDTLSEISNNFELPLWLLHRYGANSTLNIGQKIKIPVVTAIN